MLIYIIHNDKIFKFRLPNQVSGSYVLNDISDDGKNRNLINISSNNGKWYLNSNDEVLLLYNNEYASTLELKSFNFYTLQYLKRENIFLYVFPGNDLTYSIYTVNNHQKIVFGNDSKCDVVYTSQNVFPKQFELEYCDGNWKYNNLQNNIPVFINEKKIDFGTLSSFDRIFVMGLKVVLLSNKIIVFSQPGLLNVFNLTSDNEWQLAMENTKEGQIVKDFYDQSEYFLKSPVFRKKEEKHHVTITSPQEKEKNSSSSFLSQFVPSALMSVTSLMTAFYSIQNYNSGNTDKENYITSIVMCAIMLITGIVWPIIENFASKIKSIMSEKIRKHNYIKYLKRKRKILTEYVNEEKGLLDFNNLSLLECQDAIIKKTSYLFSKNKNMDTFLTVKLGVGKIESNIIFDYTRPDLIVDNDKLLDEIDKLILDFKYIDNAPFSISLKENSLAVICNDVYYTNFCEAIVLQLIALHDYDSLKIVVFTDEFSSLNKIKNLNHCWNNDRSFRYFATNLKEAESISSELIKTYNKNRELKDQKNDSSYYLIISDCISKYKSLSLIEKVMENNQNSHFSTLMFSDEISDIPTGCKSFIMYKEKEANFFKSEMDEGSNLKFIPLCIDDTINFDKCIYKLSNIPIKINTENGGSLPEKLGFLEMYGVGNLEQLNIKNRWNSSSILSSLSAPVGVDSSGNLLTLDLHEKKHGPHGLIAGMTGSGKSEFIITYILSLSICYSPNEVQFVLIDYKGGGLAGAFENRKTGIKLPHLVGTITNLDKSEMNRTLVSIKSELQRRQRKFNEAKEKLNTGNIDIYKYQSLVREGTLSEPMSHLFIICDEFAELKSQQPDFMDELVSAARIGRSLGIHLILATQKPSGVVDDQIWSNSKFKVCCKVQTVDDSKEMIMRPDAAYLKESGRFYLLVGYDQYFVEGQSGYSGVQYLPSSKAISKLDNSIDFINDLGEIYKNVIKKDEHDNNNDAKKYGEELNNILKYIVDIADADNYEYKQLWLENVPKLLYYSDLVKKYPIPVKPFDLNPLIGEYDDPENQNQNYYSLPITSGGNTYIVGASGMGKNTLLSTIIYSTIINHNPSEVNIYIIDFGTEKLRKFSKAPQVGEVLGINDGKKISYLFYMLLDEIEKRKKYYTENSGDFAMDVKSGKSVFPNIVIVIYSVEVFRESFDTLYEETFVSITRNCSKYGINFIITGSTPSSLNYVISNNFPQTIVLNLNDVSDYSSFFSKYNQPSKNPGRGLLSVNNNCMEFQTSMIFNEDDEKQNLDYVISKLNEIFKVKARSVPDVPKKLEFNLIKPYINELNNVPLGLNIVTAQIGFYNFSRKVSLISSKSLFNFINFFGSMVNVLSLCNNNNIIILNGETSFHPEYSNKIKYYESNFAKVIPILETNIKKYNNESSNKKFTIIIIGFSKINSHLRKYKENDSSICLLEELICSVNNDAFKFVIYDSENSMQNLLNGKLSEFIDNQNGIWVGKDFDMQDTFSYDNMPFMNDVKVTNDTFVIVNDSIPQFLKFPTL